MKGTIRSVRTALRDGIARRGFASMDPVRQRALASQGGKKAHQMGTAHEFTSDEARAAGRVGGRQTALRSKPQRHEDE